MCFVDKDVAASWQGRYKGSWSMGTGYGHFAKKFPSQVNVDSQTCCIEYSNLRV
jgi:hypothetical protein